MQPRVVRCRRPQSDRDTSRLRSRRWRRDRCRYTIGFEGRCEFVWVDEKHLNRSARRRQRRNMQHRRYSSEREEGQAGYVFFVDNDAVGPRRQWAIDLRQARTPWKKSASSPWLRVVIAGPPERFCFGAFAVADGALRGEGRDWSGDCRFHRLRLRSFPVAASLLLGHFHLRLAGLGDAMFQSHDRPAQFCFVCYRYIGANNPGNKGRIAPIVAIRTTSLTRFFRLKSIRGLIFPQNGTIYPVRRWPSSPTNAGN